MEVPSSVSGILNSLTPLFTFVFGIAFFNTKGTLRSFFGVLLGLCGAGILILFGKEMGASGHFLYGLMIVLATMCYATSVNTVKRHLQDEHPIALSAVAFQIIGVPAYFMLWKTDFIGTLNNDPDALIALGYLVILALIGTVLATTLFFGLVQKTDALFGSMTTYIIPIMAVILGFLDGEPMTIVHVLGMSCILAGVYMSRK
jgi:drug/metabolite transporter (DMT)-like permease